METLFSVIVPTHNRSARLTACLKALAVQDYPREHFEVIVVDDGDTIPSKPRIHAFEDRMNLSLISQTRQGPATARNAGALQAKGTCLAFTDDDCCPAADWLSRLAFHAAKNPGGAVTGKTVNALAGNPYASAGQLLVDYLYAHFNTVPADARFFTSSNLAMPADAFRAIGGFDASFQKAAGEDRELCARWRRQGRRVIYAPEAIVKHAHHLTLHAFLRQQFNYGHAAHRFHRLQTMDTRKALKSESIRFYLNLLGYPFSARRSNSIQHFGLFIVSQLAVTAGFGRAWMNS